MAYTDQTKVTNFLQRSLNANELAYLAIIIPAIKTWIDRKLGSTFDQANESTRYYDGGVQNLDIDPCTVISAVNALNDSRSSDYNYDLTTTPEVFAEPANETVKRELRKRGGIFPRGIQNIAVTAKFSEYDGAVPDDIIAVATRIAADVLSQGQRASTGNIASESLDGHAITYQNVNEIIDKTALEDPLVMGFLATRQEPLVG